MSTSCAAVGATIARCCLPSRRHVRSSAICAARRGARHGQPCRAVPVSAVAEAPARTPCTNGVSSAAGQKYQRVMLKVSGEALAGAGGFGIDPATLSTIAAEVAQAVAAGLEVAIVVGGGNFFRGVDRWDGLDRCTADYVGMLATCMNAICLQSALEKLGVDTRVQTAIEMREVAEPYIRRRAVRHLERGRVVIFGGGTGNPFFTTDTAAALRAAEIGADAFLKATKVDGVYDCDPLRYPGAKLQRHLSYREVMLKQLAVMDETAITLCKENDIHVVVFNLQVPGNALRALLGDPEVGTTIDASLKDAGSSSGDAGRR